jgi:hypothetical protein
VSTNIVAGDSTDDGDLVLRNRRGQTRIHLDAGDSGPWSNDVRVFLDGQGALGRFGNDALRGRLELMDGDGDVGIDANGYFGEMTLSYTPSYATSTADRQQVVLDAWEPSVQLRQGWDRVLRIDGRGTPSIDIGSPYSDSMGGQLWLRDRDGRARILLDGGAGGYYYAAARARVILDGNDGSLALRDGTDQTTTVLEGADSSLTLTAPNGTRYRVRVENDGSLSTTPV